MPNRAITYIKPDVRPFKLDELLEQRWVLQERGCAKHEYAIMHGHIFCQLYICAFHEK